MIFLIEYDRRRGQIVTIKKFKDSQNEKAQALRLELELDLNRLGKNHEVVLLDAASEADLRLTHRRYFESLAELLTSPG